MRPKILFVTNKWINGPSSPACCNQYDVGLSFAKTVIDYDYDFLFLDEAAELYQRHVDYSILAYQVKNPELKAVIFLRMGVSELNPTIECVKILKEQGVFICFFWQDSNPWDSQYIQQNDSLIDLNVYWDNPSHGGNLWQSLGDKHLYLWPLISTSIYQPSEQKLNRVSMIGSLRYEKRNEYVSYIRQEIPYFVDKGGQRERNLTIFEYSSYISNSSINLNFPQHGMGYDQTKSRVVEVLASRSLLLENKNISTRHLLVPDKDYIEFDTKEDLKEKILYYLEHDEEREKIAFQGYQTFLEKYSPGVFWRRVFEKLEK